MSKRRVVREARTRCGVARSARFRCARRNHWPQARWPVDAASCSLCRGGSRLARLAVGPGKGVSPHTRPRTELNSRARSVGLYSPASRLSIGGCGGSRRARNARSDSLPTALEQKVRRDSSGNQRIDTNGDGKRTSSACCRGRETCRVFDLNHDDKPDSFIYLDGQGAIRRRDRTSIAMDARRDRVLPGRRHCAKDRETTSMASSHLGLYEEGRSPPHGDSEAMAASISGGHGPIPIASSAR